MLIMAAMKIIQKVSICGHSFGRSPSFNDLFDVDYRHHAFGKLPRFFTAKTLSYIDGLTRKIHPDERRTEKKPLM